DAVLLAKRLRLLGKVSLRGRHERGAGKDIQATTLKDGRRDAMCCRFASCVQDPSGSGRRESKRGRPANDASSRQAECLRLADQLLRSLVAHGVDPFASRHPRRASGSNLRSSTTAGEYFAQASLLRCRNACYRDSRGFTTPECKRNDGSNTGTQSHHAVETETYWSSRMETYCQKRDTNANSTGRRSSRTAADRLRRSISISGTEAQDSRRRITSCTPIRPSKNRITP